MLRIIIRHDNAGMAANCGGDVLTSFKTIDIEAPEVESEMTSTVGNIYAQSQIIGVEIVVPLPAAPESTGGKP